MAAAALPQMRPLPVKNLRCPPSMIRLRTPSQTSARSEAARWPFSSDAMVSKSPRFR
jgi:hypothetical protein